MAPILGYWDIRGIGQPLRLMLEFAGVEYEERRHKCGPPPPERAREEWLREKPNLDLDFPNLPYYLDDQVRLTQSGAIFRYLGRRHGLGGRDQREQLRAELAEAQLRDDYKQFALLCYDPKFNELKQDYLASTLPEKMQSWSKFLASSGGEFVAGDSVTYADFFLFEYLDALRHLWGPEVLAPWPNLAHFHGAVLRLEPIANYVKSERYIDWPFYLTWASWGAAKT